MKIAVLGGTGFIGRKIVAKLSQSHEVTAITRENYDISRSTAYDIFINANGNSKRYLAKQDPKQDFIANCQSTFNSIYDFKFKKYIHISTLDVFRGSVYGRNKVIAENLLNLYQGELGYSLVLIRLGLVMGKDKVKGIIYDLENNMPLGVTKDSCFHVITATAVAEFVDRILLEPDKLLVFHLGGTPTVTVERIEELSGKKAVYLPTAEKQIYDYDMSSAQEYFNIKSAEEYLKESLAE